MVIFEFERSRTGCCTDEVLGGKEIPSSGKDAIDF